MPGSLFASIVFFRFYNSELARADDELIGNARELALLIDRDLQGQQFTLQALSISPLITSRNFEAFHQQASRIRDITGIDVLLRDRTGQQIINTRVAFGNPLPPPYPTEGDEDVVKTKKPFVTNLLVGGITRRPVYSIMAPVIEGQDVVFFLQFSLELQRLLDILRADIRSPNIAGIYDRNFRLMARTERSDELVGRIASDTFIDRTRTAEGVWPTTSLDGVSVRVGVARSQVADWWIWVSIPERAVYQSLQRALWQLAGIGAALTTFGLLTAYLLGKRFSMATTSLTSWAETLGKGHRVESQELFVHEFNEVGKQLSAASVKRAELEARLIQKATEESEHRFQILVNGVTDYAIYMLDLEGNVVNWNAGAERIKGYKAGEIIGQHFSQFYTEEERLNGFPIRALDIAAHKGKYEAEGLRVRKDGTRFWASVVIDAIRDETGKLVGFAKVTRDITEKREAQSQLDNAREQLFQAQKMDAVGQLTGGVAHDFNNLLMIILGNLDIAQRTLQNWKEGAEERIARAIGHAVTGARRATTLTGHLLAFSRRQPLEPKVLDVNKVFRQISGFLNSSLGEKVEVEVVGAAGLWQIEADPNHLETALLNLAVNARDAMPDGGKVTVEASNVFLDDDYCSAHSEIKPGQYVQISLSDTGTGMSKEVVQRAFEPFFTTKETGHGTGLGLSQVFGFVKQSGGHVKIYSELQQGTTVKLYLPRAHGGAQEIEEQSAFAPSAYGNETILLVEDDADVRLFVSEALRELHYRVLEAHDAKSAFALLEKEEKIDLLLTDVVLPGLNGRELADAAKLNRPNLKVLFMTGYSRNAIVHQGRLDPGVELVQKPVTQSTLAIKIRNILDNLS